MFHFCLSSSVALPSSPISLWSKQLFFSLDACVSVTFNCRILSYTTPIERHPTMTIILCSDGCNLWEPKKNIYENCSSCRNEELTGSIKQTGSISGFAVFLQVDSLNFESSEHVVIFSFTTCGSCLDTFPFCNI